MGSIGKDKTLIGITAPKPLVGVIDARAEALGWSRGKFALAILEQWQEAGAPPINKIDATMAPEVMAKIIPATGKKHRATG